MGGCENAVRPIKLAYYHLNPILSEKYLSVYYFSSFAYPIYTYYLYVKLHVMTETDGYSNLTGALNHSKLGALCLKFQENADMKLSFKRSRMVVQKWNLPKKKSGNRD